MKFPIEVKSISFENNDAVSEELLFGGNMGDWVAVRPCGEEFEGKTFLGVLLGGIPLSQAARFNRDNGELVISRAMYNPAMYVPEIKKIIYGCGSFWKNISTPEELQEISDIDIENVWYVKALKELSESKGE